MNQPNEVKKMWGLPEVGGWYTENVEVSPEIAALMLSHNQVNRPMSHSLVKKHSQKMGDGEWVYTHQGLAFSDAGTLLDGQHRLAAVIDSGVTIVFPVTYNLPVTTFDHIDVDGKMRTSADLFAIRCPEVKNKSSVCSVAHMMMRGIADFGQKYRAEEVARFAEEKKDMIVPFVREMKKGPSIIRKAPVIAAFVAAVRQDDTWPGPRGFRDRDTVMLTCMRLSEQEWEGKSDPMKTLFNRLLRNSTSKREGLLPADQLYALTVGAIRAAISNRTLSTIAATEIDWGVKGDAGGPMAASRRGKLRKRKTIVRKKSDG